MYFRFYVYFSLIKKGTISNISRISLMFFFYIKNISKAKHQVKDQILVDNISLRNEEMGVKGFQFVYPTEISFKIKWTVKATDINFIDLPCLLANQLYFHILMAWDFYDLNFFSLVLGPLMWSDGEWWTWRESQDNLKCPNLLRYHKITILFIRNFVT